MEFFGQEMESALPKYTPSISQLLIIPYVGHSKLHFLPLVLNGKNVGLLVSEFFFFVCVEVLQPSTAKAMSSSFCGAIYQC